MFEVVLYKHKKRIIKNALLSLYGNRIEVKGCAGLTREIDLTFEFDKIRAVSVLGRNKLNVYIDNMVWQFKGDKRFNALKYVHAYYRYNNMKKGEQNGKLLFLGL